MELALEKNWSYVCYFMQNIPERPKGRKRTCRWMSGIRTSQSALQLSWRTVYGESEGWVSRLPGQQTVLCVGGSVKIVTCSQQSKCCWTVLHREVIYLTFFLKKDCSLKLDLSRHIINGVIKMANKHMKTCQNHWLSWKGELKSQ